MAETSEFDLAERVCFTRPSVAQVKAVVDFMEKHPDLALKNLRHGAAKYAKVKKLWVELSHIANSIKGAMKTTKGWTKFWADKRRHILLKQKHIKMGKLHIKLTPLEQKILNICGSEKSRKNKTVKQEPYNGDDNSFDILGQDDDQNGQEETDRLAPTEADERYLSIMEKTIAAVEHQTVALAQIAQSVVSNSKAMEKIAEASHKQALAVDRLAGTFETISTSIFDVRNAVISIDYTTKRYFTASSTQNGQNTNLFS